MAALYAREHPRRPLSKRLGEIAALAAEGFHNREIAEKLSIGEGTVKNCLCHVYNKFGVSRSQLVTDLLDVAEEPGGRPGLISSGELELDSERFKVTLAGKEIALSTKEFQLLMRLMGRPGRVCTRSELLDQVWGSDRDVGLRAVDVCVLRLRQKLNDEPLTPKWIRSVWGVGYGFVPTGRN